MANTGKKITLTLKKIKNPGNVPTGDVKNNVVGDPDYVAPVQDLVKCPIVYSNECPIVKYTQTTNSLSYEFGLSNSIVSNPSIKSIRVALSSGGFVQIFNLPNTPANYFKGTFTGTTSGTAYQIIITYIDATNNVVRTCTIG